MDTLGLTDNSVKQQYLSVLNARQCCANSKEILKQTFKAEHLIQCLLLLLLLHATPAHQLDAHPLFKGHNLLPPLVSLENLRGVMPLTKVLILPSHCVPFILGPFSSQPDKLNLLRPDQSHRFHSLLCLLHFLFRPG